MVEEALNDSEYVKSEILKPESEITGNEDEDWEKVSYGDLNLDGMNDPYQYKFKNIIKEQKKMSNFATLYESWSLKAVIIKANDDVRQEVLAIQLMKRLQQIFKDAHNLPIFLRPYEIFVTSSNSGVLEFIPDTNSVDYLKKKFPAKDWNLCTFYQKYFADDFEAAQRNFVESMAGYSIFQYLFNVKDRHNGNILIDSQGHLIHIDFGFYLQNSPGNISFEKAPFKFTQEYLDIMGGEHSPMFEYFKSLLIRGLFEVRKHLDELIVLIQIMASMPS